MRLLILTQKVDKNDDVLGFFHSWILEFSKRCEKVIVICLEKGEYDLPHNTEVFSLGKEKFKIQNSKFKIFEKIIYVIRFIRYIVRMRHDYDTVFVHMNPEYVVLGGPLWRLWRKKIALWYVHRQVNVKLRIAEKLAHVIFSTTLEAFRLKSKKVHFLGHGVDFTYFTRKPYAEFNTPIRILHVGRITPIKNLDILIEAAAILRIKNVELRIKIVGKPSVAGDIAYEQELKNLVKKHGLENEITFVGDVPFTRIGECYRNADISVNLTPTGGMDKAVLESIASGTLALSANKAFKNLFGEYADYLLYNERDAGDTARKIMAIGNIELSLRQKIENDLYNRVKNNFSLDNLISTISTKLKTHERV